MTNPYTAFLFAAYSILSGGGGRPQCNCINTDIPVGGATDSVAGLGQFFGGFDFEGIDFEGVDFSEVVGTLPSLSSDGRDDEDEDARQGQGVGPTLLIAFDGAGDEDNEGNSDFKDFVNSSGYNSEIFDSKSLDIRRVQVGRAVKRAEEFLSKNPNGVILAAGYSAGGADAVRFTNRLAKRGVFVGALILFDARSGTRVPPFGGNTLNVSPTTPVLNFYQTRGTPFRGSQVRGSAVNINLTDGSNHNSIVGNAVRQYRAQIITLFRLGSLSPSNTLNNVGR